MKGYRRRGRGCRGNRRTRSPSHGAWPLLSA